LIKVRNKKNEEQPEYLMDLGLHHLLQIILEATEINLEEQSNSIFKSSSAMVVSAGIVK
jgi:hypothetical protein